MENKNNIISKKLSNVSNIANFEKRSRKKMTLLIETMYKIETCMGIKIVRLPDLT